MTETTSAPSAGEAGRAWVGIGVGATVVLLVVAGAVRRRRAV